MTNSPHHGQPADDTDVVGPMTVTVEEPTGLDHRISIIRDLVNQPRRSAELRKDARRWRQLCSCMDAVGDAEYAIDAHAALADGTDLGLLYLAHFGFVQALYLQQDAVRHLCECLGLADLAKDVDALDDVKQVRNDLAHMTNRAGRRFVGIVRPSMTAQKFVRYSFGDNDLHHDEIVCCDLLLKQRGVLSRVLDKAIAVLADDERRHRATFQGDMLSAIFDKLSYPMEKIAVGARHLRKEDDRVVALVMVEVISDTVTKFQGALATRGWFPNVDPSVDREFEIAGRAIERLRQLLNPEANAIDAEAMALLLTTTVQRLAKSAEGLDEHYAKAPWPIRGDEAHEIAQHDRAADAASTATWPTSPAAK